MVRCADDVKPGITLLGHVLKELEAEHIVTICNATFIQYDEKNPPTERFFFTITAILPQANLTGNCDVPDLAKFDASVEAFVRATLPVEPPPVVGASDATATATTPLADGNVIVDDDEED